MVEKLEIKGKSKRVTFGGRTKISKIKMPNARNFVTRNQTESILYLQRVKNATRCIIFGCVDRVSKGKDFDMLYVYTGHTVPRPIIVQLTTARKQLYTCKQRQWVTIVAECVGEKNDDGTTTNYYLANAIQSWYVPNVLDIKTDIDIDKMTEQELSVGGDILSMFE